MPVKVRGTGKKSTTSPASSRPRVTSWPSSPPPTPSLSYTRYTFRIDGRSYARYMRDQMETYLADRGELPIGVTLDLPKSYVDMTGDGELWVGEDGLPLRQILHLRFPQRADEQEITADVTVDFGFGDVARNEQPIPPLRCCCACPHR